MGWIAPGQDVAQGGAGWPELTLDRLLTQMPTELKPVTVLGADTERPLRWVATSELEDPTPFLLGGEFLLTAGVPLIDRSSEWTDAYIRRLTGAGITALGFGISPVFNEVPDVLVRACAAQGLPLVCVAEQTPFVAVTRRFAAMLEAEGTRLSRHLVEVNRRMLRAVLSGAPERSLLEALASEVRAWVVLAGVDGRISASAGRPVLELEELRPFQEQILLGSGPRVEVARFDAAHVVGHPLRGEGDINLGTLVLGSATGFDPAQHTMITLAVGLLEVLLRQQTTGSLGPSRLATQLLLDPSALLRAPRGRIHPLEEPLRQSLSGADEDAMRIVQGVHGKDRNSSWPPPGAAELHELIRLRHLFNTLLVELTDYGFVAITRSAVPDRLMADLEKLGWLIAIGEPVETEDLPAGNERVAAVRARLRNGGASVRIENVSWSVAGLLGEQSGRLLAERLLAPFATLPDERRRLMLRVLRAWLGAHGSWDVSGRTLGLHRNSVRRHVQHAAEVLRLDLDDAHIRAELLLALQFVPEEL